MLLNFQFHWVKVLFGKLKKFQSILIAILHIASEQLKVVVSSRHVLLRYGRVLCRRSLNRIKSRKLTLVIYGLFATLTLKFISLTASIFQIAPQNTIAVQVIDGALIFLVVALVYFLGTIVHPLIRMERHENTDILKFGDDFGQLLSLRGAIESMPEAFSFWDKNQRLVISNDTFDKVYHLKDNAGVISDTAETEDSLAGHKDGYGPMNYQQFYMRASQLMLRPARPTKLFSTAQYETQMRDGRWLHVNETPTVDGGLVSVSFDITKMKTSQQNLAIREQQMRLTVEDLRISRRELERKTQKLAELADKYMREKERAEDANRVKSEFLANISHELRTPLNAIIGFSDLMQRQVLGPIENEQYADYINDIFMSGSYLLELINDILDMSRIEAGRLTLETKRCNLKSLLDECLQIVAPQAEKNKINIGSFSLDDIDLVIDHRAIKQVMLNLMSNAIKFTPEGGEVELSVRSDNYNVFITVKDTGIGIEDGAIAKLGRPFEQVENQLTKRHTGTGLGLAISRSLVDLHGGALSIESEVGVGTTVLVTLPRSNEIPGDHSSADGLASIAA